MDGEPYFGEPYAPYPLNPSTHDTQQQLNHPYPMRHQFGAGPPSSQILGNLGHTQDLYPPPFQPPVDLEPQPRGEQDLYLQTRPLDPPLNQSRHEHHLFPNQPFPDTGNPAQVGPGSCSTDEMGVFGQERPRHGEDNTYGPQVQSDGVQGTVRPRVQAHGGHGTFGQQMHGMQQGLGGQRGLGQQVYGMHSGQGVFRPQGQIHGGQGAFVRQPHGEDATLRGWQGQTPGGPGSLVQHAPYVNGQQAYSHTGYVPNSLHYPPPSTLLFLRFANLYL